MGEKVENSYAVKSFFIDYILKLDSSSKNSIKNENCFFDGQPKEPRKVAENSNENKKINRRFRTSFTSCQVLGLEAEFRKNIYIDRIQKIKLAQDLDLEEKQVKYW